MGHGLLPHASGPAAGRRLLNGDAGGVRQGSGVLAVWSVPSWGDDETRNMPEQARPPVIAPSGPVAAAVEAARMAAVRRYDILDTPPDGAYDRVAALAARLFEVPVATVTIVDEDRIWFKAAHAREG